MEDENVLANICMLAGSENNTVSDADPKVYIPHALSRHALAGDDVLKSHLMPTATAHEYASASQNNFQNHKTK